MYLRSRVSNGWSKQALRIAKSIFGYSAVLRNIILTVIQPYGWMSSMEVREPRSQADPYESVFSALARRQTGGCC